MRAAPGDAVLSAILEAENSHMLLVHTLQTANYLGELEATPTCHSYTNDEIFNYNFRFWTSGLLLGMNSSHFDVGFMQHFTFTWPVMKTWGVGLWMLFAALMVTLGLVVYTEFKDLHDSGVLVYYLIYLGAVVAFFVWNTLRLWPTGRRLQIHHYMIGFMLVTLFGYQDA